MFTQDNHCKALVDQTCRAIFAKRILQPKVAIVLGSGLGELAKNVEHAESMDYAQLACFPKTHACGHAGKLITGYLAGMPVAIMQGRSHRYEGFTDTDLALPIHCLHGIGAKILIVTNAAGGLNPRFRVGEAMLIDQHIDLLWTTPYGRTVGHRAYSISGSKSSGYSVPCRAAPPYDHDLMLRAKSAARREDIELHQGTYLSTLGPTYETRSEYRMFRLLGADAVGMSTVPEVVAARQLEMRVLAISVITNVATSDLPSTTCHKEVMDVGNLAGPRLMKIVCGVLSDLAGQPD